MSPNIVTVNARSIDRIAKTRFTCRRNRKLRSRESKIRIKITIKEED